MMWNKLSMADRAKYIALGVKHGVTSLDSIRDIYNSYAEGGRTNDEGKRQPVREEILKQPDNYTPGTYFAPEWNNPINPDSVNEYGEPSTTFPEVYRLGNKEPSLLDLIYNTVTDLKNANPITSDQRVHNMGKTNQRQFHNISPRQTASGLSVIGNIVSKFPGASYYGLALQVPDLGYDIYDAVNNNTTGNWMSVFGDVSGIVSKKMLNNILPINLNLPNIDFIMPDPSGTGTPVSIPSTSIPVGKGIVPIIKAVSMYGVADDILGTFGIDMSDIFSEEEYDPDNIQIGTEPLTIEYQHNVNSKNNKKNLGGNLDRFSESSPISYYTHKPLTDVPFLRYKLY